MTRATYLGDGIMENHKDQKKQKTIGSVIKAVEIIELLSAAEDEMGVTEISQKLNYGVSASYHLLATLKMCRMIEQNNKTKKYRLGLKLWKIGRMAMKQNHLTSFIQPYLVKLRELTEETANLTIMENGDIVYIAQEESLKLIRMFTKIGARVPLHCCAAGKAILAYQPEEKQNSIISTLNFRKYTDKTVVDSNRLKEELEKIRHHGYAFDDEEREVGVSCIAAPIFDFDHEAIAAVSISGPTSRFDNETKKKFIKNIIAVTKEISEHLGYKDGNKEITI